MITLQKMKSEMMGMPKKQQFDGGKLVRKASQPKDNNRKPS
ncbi:hypothetical protein [Neobacillus niacini]|nr:hypothetical protein [Neobacillus niacini]MDR7001679.1 hypothetical protein [Neobacillus niacini]